MYVAFGLLFVAILTEAGREPRHCLGRRDSADPVWTALVLGGYAISDHELAGPGWCAPARCRRRYAVWSGVGTAAVAVVGALWLGERLDWYRRSGAGR